MKRGRRLSTKSVPPSTVIGNVLHGRSGETARGIRVLRFVRIVTAVWVISLLDKQRRMMFWEKAVEVGHRPKRCDKSMGGTMLCSLTLGWKLDAGILSWTQGGRR